MIHQLLLASEGDSAIKLFFFHDFKEVLITGSASIIVIALLVWKAGPAAKNALQARSDGIAKEIADAEKARGDAELRLGEVQERIANAENERQRILVEARQTAEALKQQIVARAEDEAEAVKVRAAADIEASKHQIVADLHDEVAALAMGAAEAVIAANLDAGTQTELIDGYIQQVGADMREHADLYADAFLNIISSEGNLNEVQAELHSFADTLQKSDELSSTLNDPHLPAARRQQIVEDLLEGKAHTITVALVSMLIAAGRIRDLPKIVERLLKASAALTQRSVAEVRSAVSLTDEQKARLAESLKKKTGQDVEIVVVVDPNVLGGIVTQIGDTVIDGSIRHRLAQLKESF